MKAKPVRASQLYPSIPESLTADQRIALWAEVTDACEELVLAGLRRDLGPGGDLKRAYRLWYTEQMEEHTRALVRMLERLQRSEVSHGS